ncbi:MAG TPA: hypothetical protein VFA20_17220 [Myxococcaceae bacterium]|nr:hypothetical protein [Myxococcaceae bacterium]
MWDHRPTADELLSARLSSGWTPTPTSTVDGEVVMGHAACLVGDHPKKGHGPPAPR